MQECSRFAEGNVSIFPGPIKSGDLVGLYFAFKLTTACGVAKHASQS